MAEVLITLGVIGVVAAMTIPTLVTNYQKKVTVQRLKSTIAIVNQAVRLSLANNGDMSGWDIGGINNAEKFNKYLLPYMKAQTRTLKANEMTYYQTSGKKETGLAVIREGAELVTLINGVDMIFSDGSVVGDGLFDGVLEMGALVDVDGYNSGHNRFGHDAFYMIISSKKGVLTMFTEDGEHSEVSRTREELKNGPSVNIYQCNKNGRGMWCGALIQADNWQIAPDYPW